MSERLLVNYWYAHNVGHAVEGLRYCLGYKAANPELSVSLLLNAATPTELAQLCPFIDDVYPIEFTSFNEVPSDPADALAGVPREWDWVVENHRAREEGHRGVRGFTAFFDAAHAHLQPLNPTVVTGKHPPAYLRNQQLRLEPPADARAAAAELVPDGRKAISIVPAGSGRRLVYPSIASWGLILHKLARRHPSAVFCLIGKLGEDGRTTSSLRREELDRLLGAVPNSVDCFDRPLFEQLAVVERSALLISPHTGFSFLAATVNTPWLAISGGMWHEHFFNGVPFYSLLPDPERYPTFGWARDDEAGAIDEDEDREGPRDVTMSAARIREDLPALLDAAETLIDGKLEYEDALRDYFPRLVAAYRGDRARAFSFENIGNDYF